MAAFDLSEGEGLPSGSSGSLACFFSHSTHTGMSWMYISVGAPQFMHLSTSEFHQNAALGYTIEHVQCPERERLVAAYLSALDRINDAGKAEPDRKSEFWRRITEEPRRECIKTLETVNEHRREHGC
jgi:hypothetical protein